jgi:cell division protein FtsQ
MKNFNYINVRLLLILGLVVFLFSFSSNRNEGRKLKKSEVIFIGENNLFIKQEAVNKLLIENKEVVTSIEKEKLNLNNLEKSIDAQPMIEKSQVFVSIDGVIKASVKQRAPIVRFFNNNISYYVDYYGIKMPLSDFYTARVPLVSGEINDKFTEEYSDLFRMIYDDDFLKKNIIGIQILPNGSVIMKNRNFDFDIVFGLPINIEEKFKNYKAFYQKAFTDKSIYKYKNINLQFTSQVVCTK